MKITELFNEKQNDLKSAKPITIAFIGDSVTQGCFECYVKGDKIVPVFDYKNAYSTRVREILNVLYPNVQINVINSGVSGDSAAGGLNRLERDVISYNPDLVVVSFGLNDSLRGSGGLIKYADSLSKIFDKLAESGTETIFLTQNYMCTEIDPSIKDEQYKIQAELCAKLQNDGVLKEYYDKAKEICLEKGVKVCDTYLVWEKMNSAGVKVTGLLSNLLNHPIREFHYYIAIKLIETVFGV